MNAEIYFPRGGKSFAQTSEKSFEDSIKKLNEIDVNIIYKTEIDLNEKSIVDALKVTDSGDEKIELVVIADGIKEDSLEKAEEFFSSIGVIEKVKRIEIVKKAEIEKSDAEDQDKPLDKKAEKQAKKAAKQLEKLNKQQERELKKLRKKQGKESDGIVLIDNAEDKNRPFAYFAEHNGKLIILLPEPQTADADFNMLIYSAISSIVRPKKKDAFWKRFIPCSGDRPIDVVRKIVLMLAICTFIVSSYMLIDILIVEPAISDSTNSGIKDLLVSTDDGESGKSQGGSSNTHSSGEVLTDFKNLLKENSDTVGWLTIPNSIIDYVVVRSPDDKDPEYYLHRDFYGNDSKYGTVFMDHRSTLDSKNMILHGHHMQDGRMFASLKSFGDIDYYKERPVFTFNTIYEKSQWKIISIFKTNTIEEQGEFFNYLRGDFATDYDFLNFIYELRVRSIVDCPVDVNENDTIVTLSTCAYDFNEFRFVVVARKVRDGENAKVDVSKASYSPNPLYPDIWYRTYGGTKPVVTTFQDAYEKGEITWYDGKKTDWSSEDDNLMQRELSEQKAKLIKELEDYIENNEYGEDEQSKVKALIEEYKNKINDAKDVSSLNDVYKNAKEEIEGIKTLEQQSAEESERQESENRETELSNARSAAITEIKNSIAGNNYRTEESMRVDSIIYDYSERINNSNDLDSIELYKREAIDALAEVKTDDELNHDEAEQRLANAKASAIAEIENYLNTDNYYPDQQYEIASLITLYKDIINSSSSVSSVEDSLKNAKTELDNVKTASDIDKENSEPSEEQPSEPSEEQSSESSEEQSSESSSEESDNSEETQQ